MIEINWNAVSVSDFSSGSNVFYNAGTAGDGITVTFGDDVQKIPAYLFYVNSSSYRPNIVSVMIGNSVTSIGSYAFSGCSGLTSITIPDSVTSIGESAFEGCSGLTEINWNAVSVGDFYSGSNVFYNAGTAGDGITVTFGDSVEKIPAYLFYVNYSSYRPNIKSVTIGNSVTSIGGSAFYNCTGLIEINWNAVSVSDFSSGSNVFYNAGTAGDGITVTFGDGVEKIPAYAFRNCSGLTSVTIGNSVTNIGNYAFAYCSGLTSIYYTGDMASWLGKTWQSNVMASRRTLYLNGNKVEGAIIIPDGVSSIPSYAFAYQTGVASVAIRQRDKHRELCV